MHIEPLERLPRSVREFLSHYAMIVVSILTALALEQVALAVEHRHQGERARHEITDEIAANHRSVQEALVATRDNAKLWHDLLRRTVDTFNAGQSTNESLLATVDQAGKHFSDSTPALKSAAWDAALSDHAVDYLDHEELTRFADLYASQRFFSQALWDTVRDSAARNLSDISLPTLLGKAEPLATIAVLNSRVRALAIMESQLAQMDAAMTTALSSAPMSAAPAVSTPAAAASPGARASAH